MKEADMKTIPNAPAFDVVVIGGGPSGAVAADALARAGRRVALIDREGRTKPCGGAIPPRLIRDFDVPSALVVAQITTARMISPTGRSVDIEIDNGFVGMVDREDFDPFLRARAEASGAQRYTGAFKRIERDEAGAIVHYRDKVSGEERRLRTRLIVGADGARSLVARQELSAGAATPYVLAYHEVIAAPEPKGDGRAQDRRTYRPHSCDVVYDGAISPDFYGWVFPHGPRASVGMGTADLDVDLKEATKALRRAHGLDRCETLRCEGAPIPLKPLERWDNGRDVVLAGDAAGVVAPSSGEGIYYAMIGGLCAAEAAEACLASGKAADLARARRSFMKEHKTVFQVLGAMQTAYYRDDDRRERFVSLCHDKDVQQLTFEAYMNKKLVRARPMAHLKIMAKNIGHLTGLTPAVST